MSPSSVVASLERPVSPCISVCAIGANGLCSGCLRSLDEIAGWSRMTAAEQWQLLARLDGRRAALSGAK